MQSNGAKAKTIAIIKGIGERELNGNPVYLEIIKRDISMRSDQSCLGDRRVWIEYQTVVDEVPSAPGDLNTDESGEKKYYRDLSSLQEKMIFALKGEVSDQAVEIVKLKGEIYNQRALIDWWNKFGVITTNQGGVKWQEATETATNKS